MDGVPPPVDVASTHIELAPNAVVTRGGGETNFSRRAPIVVLGFALAAWLVTFWSLPALRHRRFRTFGFDLGIYDQGLWLLARLDDPFVTVRGLDLFGHHVNVFFLALAPFYRLGAGPEFLLFVQLVAQASGAIAMFLLGRDLIRSRWAGVGLAVALLLNPTYQWLMWEFFHPDAVAIGPLLFAYWASRQERWGWFTVATLVALSCKEDVALSIVVLGLLIALRGQRRIGLITAGAAALWYVIATRVVIPAFNDVGPFYDHFFGTLGDSPTEVLFNAVRHPGKTWELLTEDDRQTWYWHMLLPFAFLPLLHLRTLIIAAPMVIVVVLTAFPYTRDYRYHYSSLVLTGSLVATVEAIAWLRRRAGSSAHIVTALCVVVVLGCAVFTTVQWGASPVAHGYESTWPINRDPRVAAKAEAVRLLPDRAPTSAAYNIVPHITHRVKVYEWPVPWCNINWGVDGEHLDRPGEVQWLLVDRQLITETQELTLLSDLLADEFTVRFERSDIVLAERTAPPTFVRSRQPVAFACEDRPPLE